MRTSPYGKDLREAVIKYLERGNSQQSAVAIFKLNASTINRWYTRWRTEGHCMQRKRIGAKRKIDRERFRKYMDNEEKEITTRELANIFKVSKRAIYNCMHSMGYSYKKKPIPMWRQMRKEERSRKNLSAR